MTRSIRVPWFGFDYEMRPRETKIRVRSDAKLGGQSSGFCPSIARKLCNFPRGLTEKIVHHPLFHFSLDAMRGNAIRNVVP
jgi:hypothetical protein